MREQKRPAGRHKNRSSCNNQSQQPTARQVSLELVVVAEVVVVVVVAVGGAN